MHGQNEASGSPADAKTVSKGVKAAEDQLANRYEDENKWEKGCYFLQTF